MAVDSETIRQAMICSKGETAFEAPCTLVRLLDPQRGCWSWVKWTCPSSWRGFLAAPGGKNLVMNVKAEKGVAGTALGLVTESAQCQGQFWILKIVVHSSFSQSTPAKKIPNPVQASLREIEKHSPAMFSRCGSRRGRKECTPLPYFWPGCAQFEPHTSC